MYFKADAGKGSWATYFRSLTGKVWAAYASATLIVILAVTFIYYSRKSVNVEKSDENHVNDTFGLLGLLMEYGFMVFTIICLQGTIQSCEKSEISSLRVNHNSVANIQNPFSVHLVKNELWAFSESLGPLLSIPPPVMTVAGL